MQLQTSHNQIITLAKDIAGGGEGRIWTVHNCPHEVAKIYNPAKISHDHEAKLKAMVANPPMQPITHAAIAWPTELLYQQGRFVGYLMPLIKDSDPIFNFYNPAQRKQNHPGFNWQYLHRAALNLTLAMQAVHDKGHLVGDVNESNMLMQPTALVTLVDTDSFQVRGQGQIYRCHVGKGEYTAPELQGVNFKTVDRRVEHDLFGLAVLNFQLLMEGYHPFAGVLPPGSPSVGRVDLHCIKKGIFPYKKNGAIPPPKAPSFNILHPDLQAMFTRCFVHGHKNPNQRPTSSEWQHTLEKAETALINCQPDPNHVYSNHLSSCPWCAPSPNIAQQRPLPKPVVHPKPSANHVTQPPLPNYQPPLSKPTPPNQVTYQPPPARRAPTTSQPKPTIPPTPQFKPTPTQPSPQPTTSVNQLQTSHNQTITLAKDIAGGGEGRIWTVQNRPNDVAKIYNPAKISPTHEAKLKAMVANPPLQPTTHAAIAWPTELLYQQGRFVGYLMPLIQGSDPIFNFYNPAQRKQNHPGFNWQYLHRAALNLTLAMQAVHDKGHLVGDVNESNILMQPTALITLVDTDSFQIKGTQGQIYRCLVGKPEYTPPELQKINLKAIDRHPQHDLFGLGVILFQLLMEGFHPFAGVLPPGSPSVGRVDLHCIKQGIFPYQSNEATPPPKAPSFNILHPELQNLFIRCFVIGYSIPDQRPTAREWQRALETAQNGLITCQHNPSHVYSNYLSHCPWCAPASVNSPIITISTPPLPNPVTPTRTTSGSWHGTKTTLLNPSMKQRSTTTTPPPLVPNPVTYQPPLTNPITPPQPKRPWGTGAMGLIILLIDEAQKMSLKSKIILGAIGLIIFVNLFTSQITTSKSASIISSCRYVLEIPQMECQDLVDLYNSTNGANWRDKTGWLATTTPCSWYGITCEAGHVTVIDLGYKVSGAEGNNLRGTIPNLSNLSKFQSLNLSMNHISGSIPNFSNFPDLKSIYLYDNQLSGTIPNFSNHPNLIYLILYNNQLSGLIPDFSNLPNLTQLELGNNQLSGPIPKFTNLPKLKYLYLNDNKLYDTIPDLDWASFDDVKLNNNCNLVAYDDAQAAVLSRQDSRWQELNPACASKPKPLPTHTPTPVIPSSKVSDSCSNVTEIPQAECQDLVDLYNSTNGVNWSKTTGWLVTNTPCSWYGITCESGHVTVIELTITFGIGNNLIGTVPDFTNLPYLTELNLSFNQLHGTIPNFTNLPNLTGLDLSGNQLSGTIPNFSNMPRLEYLLLDYNQLSGRIPNLNVFYRLKHNCGLVAYDDAQATMLSNKYQDPNWQMRANNCP